jgi:tetratricopeptide (TPR) repeat protein
MTPTLTHPDAEDLGRFIEGTLDEPERTAVVEHVADCDDCRIIVVDASEFFAKEQPETLAEEQPAALPSASGRWWMAAAAAVAIAVGGVWLVDARRDRLAPLKEAFSKVRSRPVVARLNDFPYVVRKDVTRGGNGEPDLGVNQVEVAANEVLQLSGNSPRMQHTKGVAGLLAAEAALAERDSNDMSDNAKQELSDLLNDRNAAINKLQSAVKGAPDNAAYLSDLAVALMAKGDRQSLEEARDACDRALRVDKRSADALFNRAKVLDLMAQTPSEHTDVIKAYNAYIEVDPSSPWAGEARDRVKYLNEELKSLP